jgi:hypothetical protein
LGQWSLSDGERALDRTGGEASGNLLKISSGRSAFSKGSIFAIADPFRIATIHSLRKRMIGLTARACPWGFAQLAKGDSYVGVHASPLMTEDASSHTPRDPVVAGDTLARTLRFPVSAFSLRFAHASTEANREGLSNRIEWRIAVGS